MSAARRTTPALERPARPRSDARTRKSIATREKIMAAATELMAERGSTDFQMSEVSERCSMSKGSLYYYFSDRDELVQAIFDRSVDEHVERVEKVVAQASSSAESIREIMRVLAEGSWVGSPLTLAMTRELLSSQDNILPSVEGRVARIVAIIAAQLERSKGEGLIRPEVDCRVVADALAGAFLFIMLDCASAPERASGEGPEDVSRFVDVMLDLALRGMGTERGRALLAQGPAPASDGTPD